MAATRHGDNASASLVQESRASGYLCIVEEDVDMNKSKDDHPPFFPVGTRGRLALPKVEDPTKPGTENS